jgi:hypothetical protein
VSLPLLCCRSRCRKPAGWYEFTLPFAIKGLPTTFVNSLHGTPGAAAGGGAVRMREFFCSRHRDRFSKKTGQRLREIGCPRPCYAPSFTRAEGDVACPVCGCLYREHPFCSRTAADAGHHFLRVLCDGQHVKL